MSNIKISDEVLKYPAKEKAFVINSDGDAPFRTAIIGVTYPNPAYRIERRGISDLTVFEYVIEGEGEILINGVWQKAVAGDTYILAPGEEHRYRASSERPWKKYWINYISDYMDHYLRACGLGTGIYRSEDTRGQFEELNELCRGGSIGHAELYKITESVHRIIETVARRTKTSDEAEKIREALSGAVYGHISLDEVAKGLHISKSGVIRCFKKKYGVSPYEYLLSAKIEIAKTLLRTTSLRVKEIAEKLEILDEHYFSTLFYKRVGKRPLAYRRGD